MKTLLCCFPSRDADAPPVAKKDINEDSLKDSEDGMVPPSMKSAGRRQSVCAEPLNPSDDEDEEKPVIHPKTDIQRRHLNEAVQRILLFKILDAEQLQQVLDAMFERACKVGDRVIEQGDDGDNFYVIESGVYDILIKTPTEVKKVGEYNNKGSFGELALMYNTPRAATIVTAVEGVLWALDRSSFRRIILKAAARKRKLLESLLENVPLLQHITPYEKMNLADALEIRKFKDGEQIIRQGDNADCMYFIMKGIVSIKLTSVKDSQHELEITRLNEGDYFGELALVTKKLRAASVYAVGDIVLAALDVLAFERLLGPCLDVMKRNIGEYESQLSKLGLTVPDLR